MYIQPFILGVLVTIFVELAILIGYSVFVYRRNKNGK